MGPKLIVLLSLLAATTTGCGGSKPPAPAPPTTKSSTDHDKTSAGDGGAASSPSPPADKHAAAEAMPHDDPNERHEKDGPITMSPLVPKTVAKTSFPKQTVGDHECLKEIPWSGKHQADFKTITDKCGTPTGMLEYVKPQEGRLHAKHDKRDHFQVKVSKGFCYRYFAVADDGIQDIDIIILKKGALLATDKTEHPVAVIDTDKLWCVDEDMDLDFGIEVDGRGAGGYTFGIWTRPKK